MSRITLEPIRGRVTVRRGDAVLVDTRAGMRLREGSYPPVVYVPRADAAAAHLAPSAKRTRCPWKGEASYFDIVGAGAPAEAAVWSYERPNDEVAAIAGHLAFYPETVSITIDED